MKYFLSGILFINSPIASKDISASDSIFFPNISSFKVKTVIKSPKQVKNITYIWKVNVRKLTKICWWQRDFYFSTVYHLLWLCHWSWNQLRNNMTKCTEQILLMSINKIVNMYQKHGLNVNMLLVGREFEWLRTNISGVDLDITVAWEQIPEIEWQIRVIKEQVCATRITLIFTKVTGYMITVLIK